MIVVVGTGIVGTHAADLLRKRGHDVRSVSHNTINEVSPEETEVVLFGSCRPSRASGAPIPPAWLLGGVGGRRLKRCVVAARPAKRCVKRSAHLGSGRSVLARLVGVARALPCSKIR